MMSRRSLTLIAAGLLAAASLQAREPVSERDQLALVALEGLMSAPAERALPLLQRTLAGSASTEVKQRALFVLSQVEDPAARTLLLQTARSGDAELRVEAIRSIGIGGDEASVGELQSIYRDGDAEIRSAVLQAWLIADRPDEVYQVAQDASDPGADEAISMLGAMGAQAQLRQLASSGRGSTSLVNALAVADDLEAGAGWGPPPLALHEGHAPVKARRQPVGPVPGAPPVAARREAVAPGVEASLDLAHPA